MTASSAFACPWMRARPAATCARCGHSGARSEGAAGWITGLRRGQSAGRAEVPFAAWDEDYGLIKINPIADWSAGAARRLHQGQRHPRQSAARARVPIDRLPALHARYPARRGHPRRTLVVGERGRQGVRVARTQASACGCIRMSAPSTHLDLLEAESIHIFREAAAQFRKPVLLYSIGKDSTVLLHLARKAFYPAKPPFPLLHVDTTWKFRDMIAFRDRTARASGST